MQKIEVADLDAGFDRAGTPVEGLVSGKAYLTSIVNAADWLSVRWSYRFQDETGQCEVYLDDEGYSISFKVSDTRHCGSSIELLARSNGEIICQRSVWVHYRFRFFKRPVLENELHQRRHAPWKIDQRSTALCGIACIFYLLASENPDQYQKCVGQLHRAGSAIIHSYEIRPPDTLYEMNPETDKDYPKGMPYADWISLASVRSIESRWGYRGRAKEVFSAINWPPMLMRLSKTLLDYEQVGLRLFWPLKTYLNDVFFSNDKLNILIKIERLYNAGHRILIMIDLDMLYDRANYSLQSLVRYHWIVYEGGHRMENRGGFSTEDPRKAEKIYFNCYSWGIPPTHSHTTKGISRNAFIRNFYGYIEMAP